VDKLSIRIAWIALLVVSLTASRCAGPPTVAISASPTAIRAGESATLTWSSTGAATCSASGDWSGAEPTASSISKPVTVAPTATGYYHYLLSCQGPYGTGTASAVLAVVPPLKTQIGAARATAANPDPNSACGAISQNLTGSDDGFYWEIGDVSGISSDPASGLTAAASVQPASASGPTYLRDTQLLIASASKWMYGAYVAEREAQQITKEQWQIPSADVPFLNFTSGYDNMNDATCLDSTTIGACLSQRNGVGWKSRRNGAWTVADVGHFSYNSGHLEVFEGGGAPPIAHVINGANVTPGGLAGAIMNTFAAKGVNVNLSFQYDLPAGGIVTDAADYAVFLQSLIRGSNPLLMSHFLNPAGTPSAVIDPYAVCTDVTDAQCGAVYSPLPNGIKWHYSITHWIEDGSLTGDGAYSSPGKDGFYPWIDASKTYYGIISRFDNNEIASPDTSPYYKSVLCGTAIRKAFLTGVVQN
jgi:hypothetical protein